MKKILVIEDNPIVRSTVGRIRNPAAMRSLAPMTACKASRPFAKNTLIWW